MSRLDKTNPCYFCYLIWVKSIIYRLFDCFLTLEGIVWKYCDTCLLFINWTILSQIRNHFLLAHLFYLHIAQWVYVTQSHFFRVCFLINIKNPRRGQKIWNSCKKNNQWNLKYLQCDLGPKLPAKCLYDLKAFIIVKFCNVLFRNLTNQNIKIKINFRKMRN